MSKKEFKSAGDKIDYLRLKKQMTLEEFERLDTPLADQLGVATATPFSILERISPVQ